MGEAHFVYILKCGDDTLYTGYTVDVARRLSMHKSGVGAKYTRGRGPLTLVHEAEYATKREAMRAEYAIKQLSRAEKLALIEGKKGVEVRENPK